MLELFMWDRCPFCRKVLNAAEHMGLREGVDYTIVDGAPGTKGRETVEKMGGKAMVPFLVDGQISMYESDDIIKYLQNKKGSLNAAVAAACVKGHKF